MSGKSFMNGDGESYCGIVPTKQPNKGDVSSPAEVVEGRPKTKENTQRPNLCRTPSRESKPSGLERVREAARKDKKLHPYPDARFAAKYPNILGRNRVR